MANRKPRMKKSEVGELMNRLIQYYAEKNGTSYIETVKWLQAEKPDLVDAYEYVIKRAPTE